MPKVAVRLEPPVPADLASGFDAIRRELGLDADFPADALAEAEEAARRGPSLAADADLRDIPFVTIDPAGSRDLDQALHLSRATGGSKGYVVRYAIADVAAFVAPGGALDAEVRRRGTTVYLPDGRIPLHPTVLSEGAASLLPGEERQALVWTITLDAGADPLAAGVRLERATVRSTRQYAYPEVQAAIDAGTAGGDDDVLPLLREIGALLLQREADRGGISLPLPEQVVTVAGGRYELVYRAPVPAEAWNAQLSLLAGIAAAKLMLDAGTGILRTLPTPPGNVVDTLRRRAAALGVPWPADGGYSAFVRSLDERIPEHAALVTQASRLLRGAGYEAFDDGARPADPVHAAVAAPYAHVTAPLRRLVDRFGNEVVLAECAGRQPPSWARDALAELPELMAQARHREGNADGMAVDLVEAAVLASRIGDVVRGVVVDVNKHGARVQVQRPAVVAPVDDAHLTLGETVDLRVVSADTAARRVVLQPA
jgi:exoribonuclease R